MKIKLTGHGYDIEPTIPVITSLAAPAPPSAPGEVPIAWHEGLQALCIYDTVSNTWVQTTNGNADVVARGGANLAPGNTTVQPTTDAASLYTLHPSLVANGSVILGRTGSPVADSVVQVIRRDLSTYTYDVKNWDGTILRTFGASPTSAQGRSFYWDGVNYIPLSFYYVA